MKFKDWLATLGEDYGGWDWQTDIDRQRDPVGIMQHGDNLFSKAARGLAGGIGGALRGELEKTGAKTGSMGQPGELPYEWKMGRRYRDILEFEIDGTDCFKENGLIDQHAVTTRAKTEAFRQLYKQEGLSPDQVRSVYMIDSSPVKVVAGPLHFPNSDKQWIRVRMQLRRTPSGLVNTTGAWAQQAQTQQNQPADQNVWNPAL